MPHTLSRFHRPFIGGVAALLLCFVAALPLTAADWPAKIPDVVEPKPGEHPRILFRKSEVPAMRERAKTPEGQAIVKRLRHLLGGDGEQFPTVFNENAVLNVGAEGPLKLPVGAFTFGHAPGYGLLYQLTGEQKYADLSKRAVEAIFAGKTDRDERYNWFKVGTGFRFSHSVTTVALAYDLSYDGWPESFRAEVVKRLQNDVPNTLKGKPSTRSTLEAMAGGGKYPPSSNHFGAYIGGPGLVAMALMGDPGVDTSRMRALLAKCQDSLRTLLTKGFGDGGWFGEGTGSDSTPMQPGTNIMIAGLRRTQGVDWSTGSMRANFMLLTRFLEWVPAANGVHRPSRGQYSHGDRIYKADKLKDSGAGWSHDGYFSIGMGALHPDYRPGAKWLYENFVDPDAGVAERFYDAPISPLHAVAAFANWPIGVEAANPTGVFPMAVHDSTHGYVISRNRFEGRNDVVFTALARTGPVGYHKVRAPKNVWLWGMGKRLELGSFKKGPVLNWQAAGDGSVTFRQGETSYAIDHSGASGLDSLVAITGKLKVPWKYIYDENKVTIADADIDLSGTWSDGTPIAVKQTGSDVNYRWTGKKKREMTGNIDGRTVTLVTKKGKVYTGTINEDVTHIDWGGSAWSRKAKPKLWTNSDGADLRVEHVEVNGQAVTLIMFDADGKQPDPQVSGDTITIGGQALSLGADGFKLSQFTK